MNKFCKKCNKTKPKEEFNKNISSKDGLNFYCKSCKRECDKLYKQKIKISPPAKNYQVINLPNEIWINIIEFPNLFFISNFGRVKRCKILRNGESKDTISKTRIDDYGYHTVTCSSGKLKKVFRIHILVGKYFIRNIEISNSLFFCHKDNNKSNNNLENIEIIDFNIFLAKDGIKKCSNCREDKKLTEYYKSSKTMDGLFPQCIKCDAERAKIYRQENKEIIREKHKIYNKNNSETIAEQKKIYYSENKERISKVSHSYYEKNKERKVAVAKIWKEKNIDDIRKKRVIYQKKKREEDPSFRLRENLQKRLSRTLKTEQVEKTLSTKELTGLSRKELKSYIENLFKPGMTWENYGFGKGKWHCDHIICCELFDFSDVRHQKVCCHYTNLRPDWQNDNLSRNDRLNDGRFAKNLTKEEKLEYLKSIGIDL